MIRIIKNLLAGFGERRHGVGRELSGSGQRGVTRVNLVEPGLRASAIGRRQRVQLAPRLDDIVAQRRRICP